MPAREADRDQEGRMRPTPRCILDRSRPCNSCVADNPTECPYPFLLSGDTAP